MQTNTAVIIQRVSQVQAQWADRRNPANTDTDPVFRLGKSSELKELP